MIWSYTVLYNFVYYLMREVQRNNIIMEETNPRTNEQMNEYKKNVFE